MHWVSCTYFNMDALKATYPAYKYPGYFFNAGQIFLTGGAIEENVLNEFFNQDAYPYWKKSDLFSMETKVVLSL